MFCVHFFSSFPLRLRAYISRRTGFLGKGKTTDSGMAFRMVLASSVVCHSLNKVQNPREYISLLLAWSIILKNWLPNPVVSISECREPPQ